MKVTVTRSIAAPVEQVFGMVSSVHEMAKLFPDRVLKIETLSENETGVGARHRELRLLGKREDVVEIETTEYVPNERVVSVADKAGSLWYTGFDLAPEGAGTLVTLTMEAQPKHVFARIMNAFMKSALRKGAATEVDEIKAHLERNV